MKFVFNGGHHRRNINVITGRRIRSRNLLNRIMKSYEKSTNRKGTFTQILCKIIIRIGHFTDREINLNAQ